MPDAVALADLGRAALGVLWLPVAAWTALALAVEAALRLTRAEAAVGLPVRGAALAALPLSVAVPAAVGAWAPETAAAVARFAPPAVTWLPEVVVGGGAAPALAVAAPPLHLVVLGALTVLAAVASGAALVRLGGGAARLRRARRRLVPAPPEVAAALGRARGRLGVGRPVAAVTTAPGVAPFTVGWRRPVVAVPADLGGAALDVALAHELAHVRRSDYAWHAAQRALVSAFAWHPLAWALGRGLDLDRERAADAAVLAACPGRRRTYADLLLRYASLPAPPLAVGAGRGDSFLKTRIDAMTTPLSPVRARRLARRGRIAGLLTLALAAGLAATTAPTTDAPTLPPALSAFSDSTQAAIESVEVQAPAAAPATVTVTLKPGYGRAVAEAVAAEARYPDGDDRLVVRYEGGAVERAVALRGAASLESNAPAPPDPPTVDGEVLSLNSDLAEYVDVRRLPDGRASLDVALKGGATNADAEALADQLLRRGGVARVRVVLSDGRVVERGGVETGRLLAPPDTTDEVYELPDVMPELIGGLAALQERVEYPEFARRAGIEGQVVVQFVVTETGGVVDPVVLRSPHDMLTEASIAAVRGLRFEPGREDGEAVPVRFAVPVTFRLPGSDTPTESSARAERFPNARLTFSGLVPSQFRDDTALFDDMLVASGQIVRERNPALPDGAQATVRFRLDSEGRLVPTSLETDSPNDALGGMTRGLVGTLVYPAAPDLAGRSFELTTTYVRGD